MKTLEDSADRIVALADILYGFAMKDWEDYQSLKRDVGATLDSIQTTMAPAVEKLRGGISRFFPSGVRRHGKRCRPIQLFRPFRGGRQYDKRPNLVGGECVNPECWSVSRTLA